jgi:hypothetical protein
VAPCPSQAKFWTRNESQNKSNSTQPTFRKCVNVQLCAEDGKKSALCSQRNLDKNDLLELLDA